MESMKRWRPTVIAVAAALIMGAVGGLLTWLGMEGYRQAAKPLFTPPDWLFPVVWTVLYLLMGIGMGRVWRRGGTTAAWIYGGQLVLNVLWCLLFFPMAAYGAAFWLLCLLLGTVLLMVWLFALRDRGAALLQLPYVLWLCFALVLNGAVALMN